MHVHVSLINISTTCQPLQDEQEDYHSGVESIEGIGFTYIKYNSWLVWLGIIVGCSVKNTLTVIVSGSAGDGKKQCVCNIKQCSLFLK